MRKNKILRTIPVWNFVALYLPPSAVKPNKVKKSWGISGERKISTVKTNNKTYEIQGKKEGEKKERMTVEGKI